MADTEEALSADVLIAQKEAEIERISVELAELNAKVAAHDVELEHAGEATGQQRARADEAERLQAQAEARLAAAEAAKEAAVAEADDASSKLKHLSQEVADLRAMIAEGLLAAEAMDASSCSLGDIGRAFLNQLGKSDRLDNRLLRERDERMKLVEADTAELQAAADAAAKQVADYEIELERATSEANKSIKELNAQIQSQLTDLAAIREHLASSLETSKATIAALLQRPHRLLEIYGEEVYQAAKDSYAALGGDASLLPQPELDALREKEESQAAEDAAAG